MYLRQMLAAFFTTFASSTSWGQETLEQAFLPTMRTLFDAPHTSPLVEVDQDSVVRLLLNLTRPGMNEKATQVSCEISKFYSLFLSFSPKLSHGAVFLPCVHIHLLSSDQERHL